MICCCSLAGTKQCMECANNKPDKYCIDRGIKLDQILQHIVFNEDTMEKEGI